MEDIINFYKGLLLGDDIAWFKVTSGAKDSIFFGSIIAVIATVSIVAYYLHRKEIKRESERIKELRAGIHKSQQEQS